MSFWGELRRRNVVRVALAYAAVSWLLIQIVTSIEEPLDLPGWFDTFVIVSLGIGFPIALLLSWAFEITPEGLRPTVSVQPEESITRHTGQRLNRITISVLTVAVAVLLLDRFVLQGQDDAQLVIERSTVLPDSIAVLPFENLSPDRGDAYFAPGLHEEILNQLVKIQNLTVIARTTMSQYENTDKSIAEIADELNVEAVMEGSVRFANGVVRVTAQLIDPTTGGHLWSDTYEDPFEDVFAIEADVAMNVANAMAVEFSLEEQERIEEPPTDSAEAYELYLAALAGAGGVNWGRASDLIDEALEKDPNFALAWALKSRILGLLSGVAPPGRRDALRRERLDAVLTASAIDPGAKEVLVELAAVRANRGEWVEAERAYRRALGSDFLGGEWETGLFSLAVANFPRVLRMAEYAKARDPLNSNGRLLSILGLGLSGDVEGAGAEYERSTLILGGFRGAIPIWMALLRLGAEDTAVDDIPPGANPFQDDVREMLDSPEEGLARVRELWQFRDNLPIAGLVQVAVWAAHFGDPEFAFEAAELAAQEGTGSMMVFWFPAMREVRQMPSFKALVRDVGLFEYWNEFGWPNICSPLGEDDFVCR